eukprot:CAMPEP_0178690218 /NCGR_PEP_ID=MMETSP0699-20121125/5951_1 /TAXON_ID=265572 /ORGANISM="Extubocellulus spinifer, Strain CCMP396" /LENGTH=540 /DNA_ID=CAMNT_0020335327 /DNA_START=217 /DNA_END=1839 /DNA_ORIENTATION=+
MPASRSVAASTSTPSVRANNEDTDADSEDGSSLNTPREVIVAPSNNDNAEFFRTYFASSGAPQLLVLAFLLSFGIGSVVSIVPEVLSDRFARLSHSYAGQPCSSYEREDLPLECTLGGQDAQNAAAIATFAKNALILIFASIVGSVSDCRGRKGFLAFAFFLSSLAPLVLVVIQFESRLHPRWYYAAECSTGLVSTMTVALTMLSDSLPKRHRAPGYGIFLSAFMTGFALSQGLAVALSHTGVSIAATCLLLSGCIFTLFSMPETLSADAKMKAVEKRAASGDRGVLQIIARPIRELGILNRDRFFRRLAVVGFCSAMIYSSDTTLIIYYMEEHLAIGYQSIAYMLFAMSFLGVLVQVFLLKAVIAWFGEQKTLILGLFFGASHNFIYGIADSQSVVFVGLLVSELTSLHYPVLVALRSFNVGEDEQGHVQGAFHALASIANAVGPVLLQAIYNRTKDLPYPGPGTMFVFGAGVFFSGCVVACTLPSKQANCQDSDTNRQPSGEAVDLSPQDTSIELESQQEALLEKNAIRAANSYAGTP